MAYYFEDYPDGKVDPQRTGPRRSWLPVFLLTCLAVLPVCIYVAPMVRERWNQSDPEFILKKRMLEAKAEADAHYRLRQAELKAQAEVAADRLAKYDIMPPPFRDLAARVGPAVVSIRNEPADRDPNAVAPRFPQFAPGPQDRFDPRLPPQRPRDQRRSEASGVIVKHEGNVAYVLTNSHAVRDATRLSVTLASGRTIPVPNRQIFADPDSDLAVVQIDVSDVPHLVTAEFGDSAALEAGDWVVAIGNPFGLNGTVTAGIVSAKARDNALKDTELVMSPLNDIEFIQTDAAVNPGSSGGPLLDLKGRIVGINTAIATMREGNVGVGFAIPGRVAQDVFEQLIQPPHHVRRGFLGVAGMRDLTAAEAARFRVGAGVTFSSAPEGMPAAEAGLKPGDALVRFEDKEITHINQLRRLIMEKRPGAEVLLEVVRLEGQSPTRSSVKVTLGDRAELMEKLPVLRR